MWEGFSIVDDLYSLEDGGVGEIGVFHSVLRLKHVGNDVTGEESLQKGVGSGYHEITALGAILLGIAGKDFHDVLLPEIGTEFRCFLHLLEQGSILIYIPIGKGEHLTVVDNVLEVGSIA